MQDLQIILDDQPGALAKMGEVLGAANISLEGGGVFVHRGQGVAHFLVEDGIVAKKALEAQGMMVESVNHVLIQKLNQEIPGQLGKICRIMAQNNVNILVQYSDHNNQLILVVDDYEKGSVISENWRNGNYD